MGPEYLRNYLIPITSPSQIERGAAYHINQGISTNGNKEVFSSSTAALPSGTSYPILLVFWKNVKTWLYQLAYWPSS